MPRFYKPGSNVEEKLKSLESAIIDRPPFCSGTVPVADEDLLLFYGKPTGQEVTEGEIFARRLDFTKATEDGLKRLVDTCDAATFGKNKEDVLDLSYRSAWKLDPVHFATKLNILHAGLMDSVRYNLLTGDQGRKTFFAELHKLNVYGKGSFFKPHKDTPRGDKMFGSLVVVLPTAHEGGTLFLRHHGKEWKFESDIVSPASISYVAFFGDVEHEVAEVTSGYRVTLTYNLYFGESLHSQAIISLPALSSAALFTSLPPYAAAFQSKLSELLSDDTFLPNGGLLGFGLAHEYAFDTENGMEDALVRLKELLKGGDAVIMQACRALDLCCFMAVCYRDKNWKGWISALSLKVLDLHGEYYEDGLWEAIREDMFPAVIVNSDRPVEEDHGAEIDLDKYGEDRYKEKLDAFVHWVTKQTPYNAFESHLVANFGNEPALQYGYGHVCLIVKVGRPGCRSDGKCPSEFELDLPGLY